MNKLLFSLLAVFVLVSANMVYAQDNTHNNIRSFYMGKAFTEQQIMSPGDSCSVVNPERHDGFAHANGYTAFTDSVRMVLLFHPQSYPWNYTKVCIGWTALGGVASLSYQIVMYDSGSGGQPNNLLYKSPVQTATTIPAFPSMNWYSSVLTLPTVNSGAVYIGIVYDNNPATNCYLSMDEAAATPLWPGWYGVNATFPATWQTIQSVSGFGAYKCVAARTEGAPAGGNVRNFALNLPTPGVNTNYVVIPYQGTMAGITNVTIEAWVKLGGLTTNNTIFNKGGASFDYQLGVNATTGLLFFRAQSVITTSVTTTMSAGVWTHIAATYDGSNVKFIKNGVVETIPASSPLGTSTNEMRIGRGNADPGSGNIEELRLWNVARTQGQIDSNKCKKYPSSFSSNAGLKGLWHLDSTLVDSVSGWNGSPAGTISFDTVSFPIPGANCNLVAIDPISNIFPKVYGLEQNYPNPFNPSTVIKFNLPKGEFVELKIYDILGKEVKTLVQEPMEAGVYSAKFDAGSLASGVYFYKIIAGNFTETKKMLLIK